MSIVPVGAVVAAARWQHPSQEWLSIVAVGPRPLGVGHNCHDAASVDEAAVAAEPAASEAVDPCCAGNRDEDGGNCVDVCKDYKRNFKIKTQKNLSETFS